MTSQSNPTAATPVAAPDLSATIIVPLNRLKASPRNARKVKHSAAMIEALAASIKAKGVLQPPVVEVERDGAGAPTGGWLVTIGEGRRRDASISLSIVLSMPAGTDAVRLHDAARAFASATFGERFAYVFALHDEGRHPHVHLTVRRLGRDGERLNPRKADLQAWREGFARALRDRSVEAEATPRRTRGVSRKAERIPVRKMRERFAAGEGALPEVLTAAYRAALTPGGGEAPWLEAIRTRELAIRRVLVAEALRLSRSERPGDRALAALVERFVRERPAPMTRNQALRQRREIQHDPVRSRER